MSAKSRIPHPPVRLPSAVSIKDESLEFQFSEAASGYQTPADGALITFAKLADAPDDKIAQFALRYGVLNACQIKTAAFQQNTDVELPDGSHWTFDASDWGFSKEPRKEPLELWRFLARRAAAILRINAALRGRSRSPRPTIGAEADWRVLGVEGPLIDFEVNNAQFFLSREVNCWLETGSVGLELGITQWSRTKTDWKLEVRYRGLFGALAYRLLLVIVGEGNLFACDGCGFPYIRTKRAPRPGEENFCDDCDGVAAKRAVQRFREKNREKKRSKAK